MGFQVTGGVRCDHCKTLHTVVSTTSTELTNGEIAEGECCARLGSVCVCTLPMGGQLPDRLSVLVLISHLAGGFGT